MENMLEQLDDPTSLQSFESYPLVSVTIPSYNASLTIAETLNSVIAQTYQNIEIIVVDDGSTDDTQKILSCYTSNVISIRQNNSGLASARNVGCLVAKGKYIALMDADDVCMPERIAIQVAYMEQNPDIVMCSSDFSAFNQGGLLADSYIARCYSRVAETTNGLAGIYPHHEELRLLDYEVTTYSGHVYDEMVLGSFIHPPTVLFRRSILDKCGLVDDNIVNLCDFDWFVRMSRVGKIGFIARSLLKYRFSENQMSGSKNGVQMALDIVQVMEKTKKADMNLFLCKPERFLRYLGNAYLDAADALVESQPFAAITLIIQGAMCGVVSKKTLKVLLKSFIPNRLLLRWRTQSFTL